MDDKKITLHGEAAELFGELRGIDKKDRNLPINKFDNLLSEEKHYDIVRFYLIILVGLIAEIMRAANQKGAESLETRYAIKLKHCIEPLLKHAGKSKKITLKHRGLASQSQVPAQFDYIVKLGSTTVDVASANAVRLRLAKRDVISQTALVESFQFIARNNIMALSVHLDTALNEDCRELLTCLCILAGYKKALANKQAILVPGPGNPFEVNVIKDENAQAEPNLTLVAGMNRLSVAAMNKIVMRVYSVLVEMEEEGTGRYTGVYNGMFGITKIESEVRRPPLEVNKIAEFVVPDEAPPTKEKQEVFRLIKSTSGGSPQEEINAVRSIYGDDYHQIDQKGLGERIECVSKVLKSMEKLDNKLAMEQEVIKNVHERFWKIPAEVFDDVFLDHSASSIRCGDKVWRFAIIHEKILYLLRSNKKRADVKKKMKNLVFYSDQFDFSDFETIARDFNISVEDAEKLIGLLKRCFDDQGRFLRVEFEISLTDFARYEKKVFEFLWHYLKETVQRNDRVAFLNSLQLLINKLQQPIDAISILFEDIIRTPTQLEYSDRNAFLLATLLLRKYNQELKLDIEITPEEVLLVKDGLALDVVQAIYRLLDKHHSPFLKKSKAIHARIVEALSDSITDEKHLSIRYLLSLQRESLIFLALVGGVFSRALIRSSLKFYGDPTSSIYNSKIGRSNIIAVLQHLKVILRCLGRVGQASDRYVIDAILKRRQEFRNLHRGDKFYDKVEQVMEMASTAQQDLIGFISRTDI